MAGPPGHESLKWRKQALLLESDLNRVTLRLEYERLRAATARLDEAFTQARRFAPLLAPAAAIAGWLVGKRRRQHAGRWGRLVSLWRLVPSALAIWRQFRAVRRDGGN